MNKWLVAVTVMLPTLVVIIDTSVVNVSLGHIRGSLSAGIDESTWVITSYLAANAIVIPMTGWLSRFFGRKRFLLVSIGLFTLSSFFCGASWSLRALIFFRILQGLSGGSLQPISQAILLESFPRHQHGTAMAIFGIGIMIGPIIGPLLGGWITDNWSWHWVFFVNIPIGIVAILMATVFIVDPDYAGARKVRVDYMGLAFLAVGIGCLQVVLDQGQREDWFASPFILWLSVISLAGLVFFVVNEYYAEHPIVDLHIFKNLTFASGNVIAFATFFTLFGSLIMLPIFLQTLMGYTAFLAGWVLGPGGLMAMISMPIAGRLITRVNPKAVLFVGAMITAWSVLMMSWFNLTADFYTVAWPRIVMGFGMGLVFVPLTTLTMSWIHKEEMGNASSVFNLVRNLGGSFGVAFASTLVSRRAQFHHGRLAEGMSALDLHYQEALPQVSRILKDQGFAPSQLDAATLGVLYKRLVREASMMAFNDTFFVLAALMAISGLLVLFMQRSHETAGSGRVQPPAAE
ncbi:MAG: DHA2 family efflux MFS transporter permease subunit [Deltaproteobacteria bacterium]|nr:DHA2 family efflux MFS transporter permease subunit [Deltaproteobacteria bacterium]